MSVLRELEQELNQRRIDREGGEDGCGCIFIGLILIGLMALHGITDGQCWEWLDGWLIKRPEGL